MLTDKQKLECAIEAIAAHGKTGRCYLWFKKWRPEELKYGMTTMQYSASCVLMDAAYELITGESARGLYDLPYRLEDIVENGKLVAYKPVFADPTLNAPQNSD